MAALQSLSHRFYRFWRGQSALTQTQALWVSRLTADITAQQKANRIKRRKLAGLRHQIRHDRGNLLALGSLNTVHCGFIERLEREHPELGALIEEHQRDRLAALDRPRRAPKVNAS